MLTRRVLAAQFAAAAILLGAPPAKWSVHEITLQAARHYANPYLETAVHARFVSPAGIARTVQGFWDGGQTFRVRFTPDAEGRWTYETNSEDPGLGGKKGEFTAGPAGPGTRGFLRVVGRHFAFDDGTPYFMLGQTYYELINTARHGEAWKAAIEGSRAHGVTKVRFRIHIKTCGVDDNPLPCGQWWFGDKDTLDLNHFRALDAVVDYLSSRGMIAELMPFDSAARAFGTPEQDARYLDYVIARYAAYPAVTWCLTNEYQRTSRPVEYLMKLGEALRSRDPWHVNGALRRPLSIHPLGGVGQGDRWHFAAQDWPSHVILQIGRWTPGDAKLYGVMLENRKFNKPVVNDEFGYFGDSLWRDERGNRSEKTNWYTRENHRTSMWAIYMAGAYASIGDKNRYAGGRPYKSSLWENAPEYRDVQSLSQFFTASGLRYWLMEPDNSVIVQGGRVYCLALPGEQYAFYTAAGGPFKVRLAPGTYHAVLHDPRGGPQRALGTLRGGVTEEITVPAGEDWAVLVTAAAGRGDAKAQ